MKKKQKLERHIVTWSQEEDDILRQQIQIHGTDNWAVIASNFNDKTTRQCRRRWYTYLNSDFKKGGWTPEEDLLLCEAQKVFGNRWTEIAKVVSGRTDNAVKNRFSTLCKKKAKHDALSKENSTSYVNLNNKRVMFESAEPLKQLRNNHFADTTEHCNNQEVTRNQLPRPPLAVLVQNLQRVTDLPTRPHAEDTKEVSNDGSNMIQGTYLKKDDPKIIVLMQQAQLLSSLAFKVNTDNTDQSHENALKELEDFLNKSKEIDMDTFKICDMDFHLENFKEWVEDVRSSNQLNTDKEAIIVLPSTEFTSPLQVTPIFKSLAADIPSPHFSESEKHFLMKTLGVEAPSSNPSAESSHPPPPCKRVLLPSL